MIQWLRERVHDPDRMALHRALRVALAMPPVFAFGLHVVGDIQFALLASFGTFAAMAMADFTGPARSRLIAHAGLCVVGIVLVVLGTVLSQTLWPAVLAMLAVGAGCQFAAVLGGQFALGCNAAIIAFVVAVMVPAGNEAIVARVGGWITAMVCAAAATSLLWPRNERRDLYERLREACGTLAGVVRAVAAGADPAPGLGAARAAVDDVRKAQLALGFRPIGPAGHQQALLGLADELSQAWSFANALAAAPPMSAGDARLAGAVAGSLDAVADVLAACAEGRHAVSPDLDALIAARHAHRAAFTEATGAAVAANMPTASIVAGIEAIFPLRVLSFVVLSMATDAIVITGRAARVDQDDFGVAEPTAAEGALHHARRALAPHLARRSVWLRNSLRAGVALALSVLVAKVGDLGHAFWVVLATLTVLRSNVATTGSTVVDAILGTFAGFVLASVLMLTVGAHAAALWVALPLAVFLAAYAPAAISLAAGQAMFALLVVLLFNLIVPEGWEAGAVRLEAVVVGALVALAASLIMWPKGATAALRTEVAAHVRAVRRLTEAVFAKLLGRAGGTHIDAARVAAVRARRRAEEALAAYAGERGDKRVPLTVWGALVRMPVAVRSVDDGVVLLDRIGYCAGGAPVARQRMLEAVDAVCASLDELAARLEDADRAPDGAVGAAIADLDMARGLGRRGAGIAAAIAEWLDAHRQDPAAVTAAMGLSWGTVWIGYLAHLRVVAEDALVQTQPGAASAPATRTTAAP
jgi:uncharacterized membrane protein YccC